jgi:hypothetical protein
MSRHMQDIGYYMPIAPALNIGSFALGGDTDK